MFLKRDKFKSTEKHAKYNLKFNTRIRKTYNLDNINLGFNQLFKNIPFGIVYYYIFIYTLINDMFRSYV